jgi:putative membrane protein insertion efficiency factor
MFPASCRYYPTCSEYAKWQFENTNVFVAFYKTFFRICRCNQLFEGGIEYPQTTLRFKQPTYGKLTNVKYWYVPVEGKKNRFYVIKSFDKE